MAHKPRKRFSLLMLAYGERYLEDRAVILEPAPPLSDRRLKGRLKVATWSLTFEPDDPEAPLMRIMLRDCDGPPQPHSFEEDGVEAAGTADADGLSLAPRLVLHKRSAHQPFASLSRAPGERLAFALLHAPLRPLLALVGALHGATQLPEPLGEERLRSIGAGERAPAFDLTALVDPLEEHAPPVDVTRISPMMLTPATLVLSDSQLYLHSDAAAAASAAAVSHWPLAHLRRAVRRRHLMRHTALELRFSPAERSAEASDPLLLLPGAGIESTLVSFSSHAAREAFLQALAAAREKLGLPPLPPPPEARLPEMVQRWRHGLLSNYEYLCHLNDAAGRSCADLAQYPVMPWVLQDYTSHTLDLADPAVYRDLSKPVGALDASRLALFRERYASMPPGDACVRQALLGAVSELSRL